MLIAQIGGLLKRLIVVDAEASGDRSRALEQQAADLGRKITGSGVPERRIRLEAVNPSRAQTAGETIQLRVVPRNGERDRRVEQHVEIVRVMRVLQEVIGIEH